MDSDAPSTGISRRAAILSAAGAAAGAAGVASAVVVSTMDRTPGAASGTGGAPFYVVTDEKWGASGTEIASALQACIDDMGTDGAQPDGEYQFGGTIVIPTGTWTLAFPPVLKAGVHIVGAGRNATVILSDVGGFTWVADLVGFVVEHLTLSVSGGHLFTPSDGDHGIYTSTFRDCNLFQNDPVYGLMHHDSALDYDNVTVEDCDLSRPAESSVPGWYVRNSAGAANENRWSRCWVRSNNTTTTPFFHLESSSTESYAYDNRFVDLTGEQNQGGLIRALSTANLVVDNVVDYDATTNYAGNLIHVGRSPVDGGLPSRFPVVRNSGRRGGTLNEGSVDIAFPTRETTQGLIQSPNHSSDGLKLDIGSAPFADGTTVINAPPLAWSGQSTGGGSQFGGTVSAARLITRPVELNDEPLLVTDARLGNHFRVTLGGNRKLSNPTDGTDGQKILYEVIQDVTGFRALTFDTAFTFGASIPSITLTTTGGKRDFLECVYDDATQRWYVISVSQGY